MTKLLTNEYIRNSYKEYAIYVSSSRAIPRITDGLKGVQRKILWVLRNKTDKIKTVSLAGEIISENLYVHGDQSAQDAISSLAAPYLNNRTIIEGIGNFGSRISPNGWGAGRYTYVKKSKNTERLIYCDMDIIPLVENYDGSNVEPETFLPLIPIVLLNGVFGIVPGWATSILPRSFSDLIEATIAAIDGKRIKRLVPKYEYLNIHTKLLEKNKWEFSGSIEILDTTTVQINELPPSMGIDKIKDHLNKLEEEDLINDYTDNSTDVINIEVKFKRGVLANMTEDSLLDFFKLREKQAEAIVVVDWDGKTIKQYDSAEEIVEQFVQWRIGWYTKRYNKNLNDDTYELKYWEALKKCFDEGLAGKIQAKKNKQDLENEVRKITKDIGIDDKQVDKIVSLPSYKWCQDFYQEIKDKIKELKVNMKEYKSILRDKVRIKEIYKTEVLALRK
jgi:DNA gyrase/topoisomerase IV subunit A